MTQTPREAAEAVRNEAVRLCGVFGLGLDRMKVRSLVVALKAIPLPAPSEPTAEGQVVYPAICLPLVLELASLRAGLARMKAAMEEARQLIFDDCADDARIYLAAALKGTSP